MNRCDLVGSQRFLGCSLERGLQVSQPAPLNHAHQHQHHHHSQHQQKVNQAAQGAGRDPTQQPQNHQNDGQVRDSSQYAFTQYSGKNDLQGLAAGFDSNADAVFNMQDAKFAEFAVWRDVNANGLSHAGEVRSLGDLGLTSINLASDGVVRTPAADAAFDVSALAYNVNGDKLSLLGRDMKLNLSSFVATHGDIQSVDLSGADSNTIKINLSDLMQDATTASLVVNGDGNYSVVQSAAQWTRTSTVQGEGANSGHSCATYRAANGLSSQLLIDQQLMEQLA